MVTSFATAETTDIRLAAMHLEIAHLEAACKEGAAFNLAEIKQRLNFLVWKKESISIIYNWKEKEKSGEY
jgi:hypothetical protein